MFLFHLFIVFFYFFFLIIITMDMAILEEEVMVMIMAMVLMVLLLLLRWTMSFETTVLEVPTFRQDQILQRSLPLLGPRKRSDLA